MVSLPLWGGVGWVCLCWACMAPMVSPYPLIRDGLGWGWLGLARLGLAHDIPRSPLHVVWVDWLGLAGLGLAGLRS